MFTKIIFMLKFYDISRKSWRIYSNSLKTKLFIFMIVLRSFSLSIVNYLNLILLMWSRRSWIHCLMRLIWRNILELMFYWNSCNVFSFQADEEKLLKRNTWIHFFHYNCDKLHIDINETQSRTEKILDFEIVNKETKAYFQKHHALIEENETQMRTKILQSRKKVSRRRRIKSFKQRYFKQRFARLFYWINVKKHHKTSIQFWKIENEFS
jgi:hypothetical protein